MKQDHSNEIRKAYTFDISTGMYDEVLGEVTVQADSFEDAIRRAESEASEIADEMAPYEDEEPHVGFKRVEVSLVEAQR